VSTELGEKSYSTATLLSPENLQAEVMKALEQIGEGLAPVIHVHRSFRYFCRTHLDGLGQGGEPVKLLAHPQATELMPGNAFDRKKSLVVAIGPESGWSPGELTHFEERGFHRIGLGPRVMRVEIALVFLLGQIRILGVE
jgi:RsmE family RNA methyltransferase